MRLTIGSLLALHLACSGPGEAGSPRAMDRAGIVSIDDASANQTRFSGSGPTGFRAEHDGDWGTYEFRGGQSIRTEDGSDFRIQAVHDGGRLTAWLTLELEDTTLREVMDEAGTSVRFGPGYTLGGAAPRGGTVSFRYANFYIVTNNLDWVLYYRGRPEGFFDASPSDLDLPPDTNGQPARAENPSVSGGPPTLGLPTSNDWEVLIESVDENGYFTGSARATLFRLSVYGTDTSEYHVVRGADGQPETVRLQIEFGPPG